MPISTLSPDAVILLGTDTPIGLAILRDLDRNGFRAIGVGRESRGVGALSRHCRQFYLRKSEPAELLTQLLDVGRQHGARYLLAIAESDLVFLNEHRDRLEPDLMPLIAPAEQLQKVLDKKQTLDVAQQLGIEVPQTLALKNIDELADVEASIEFPVVLKWSDPGRVVDALNRLGIELLKAEFASDLGQLAACLNRYQQLDELPLIQQYCPGRGVGHMFLARDGNVLLEFQHERVHEWPAEGGVSTLCRSVSLHYDVDARARSAALLKALNWNGVAMVEYRFDEDTQSHRLMEINGRFWGSLPLAISAGVPFAAALVGICGRGDPSSRWCRPYREIDCIFGLPELKRMLKLFSGRSAIQDPFYVATPWRDLVRYLRALLRRSTAFYVFRWSDIRPFLGDIRSMLRKVLRGS